MNQLSDFLDKLESLADAATEGWTTEVAEIRRSAPSTVKKLVGIVRLLEEEWKHVEEDGWAQTALYKEIQKILGEQ